MKRDKRRTDNDVFSELKRGIILTLFLGILTLAGYCLKVADKLIRMI